MTVEIELRGQRRRVEVTQVGGEWRVRLDGRAYRASIAAAGPRWSLLLGVEGLDAGATGRAVMRSYEIAVEPGDGGERLVSVDGRAVVVTVVDPRARSRDAHAGAAGSHPDGTSRVVAPMAGKVVKLLVAPGDAVAARQGVVVVEAMKMENELRAPRAGRVAEVHVAEGASVDARALLVVIE